MVHPDLASLYERYGYAVYRRCRYLLGTDDEAWDAVQEVFLRADAGLARFEGRASPRTWLDTIATRHCLNVLRAGRVRGGRGLTDAAALDEAGGLSDLYPAGDPAVVSALTVRTLLSQFDSQTQEAAVFYFVDELSQEDVATRVGLSVPTLRKRLNAFLERARRHLAGTDLARPRGDGSSGSNGGASPLGGADPAKRGGGASPLGGADPAKRGGGAEK